MIFIVDLDSVLSDHQKVAKCKSEIDLYFDFFKHFFVMYPNTSNQFMFILQKSRYADLLCKFVLEKYKTYNIRFVILENQQNLFVCHYFYHLLQYYENNTCQIITNKNNITELNTSINDKPVISMYVLKMYYKQFQSTKKTFSINRLILSKINKINLNYKTFYLTSII